MTHLESPSGTQAPDISRLNQHVSHGDVAPAPLMAVERSLHQYMATPRGEHGQVPIAATSKGAPNPELASQAATNVKLPWQLLMSELIGTGLLIAVGLSAVIFDFGRGSPMIHLLASGGARRALTGFLFGTVGALITFSPVGRLSGAHMNPAVSAAFYLEGKLSALMLAGYVTAQLAGATIGAAALLSWGSLGKSVHYGATVPGPAGSGYALLGETATTFCLIAGLFTILSYRSLRKFAPLLFPPLYAVMVYLEGPLSGTSTNPARSLGPAIISGDWHGFWVYLVGPAAGMIAAISMRKLPSLRKLEVEVAKVHHFDKDPYRVFH